MKSRLLSILFYLSFTPGLLGNAWVYAKPEFQEVFERELPQMKVPYFFFASQRQAVQEAIASGHIPISEIPSYESHLAGLQGEFMWAHIIPLTRKYSWAIPNDAALDAIQENGPILEIGAGHGYWAHLLSERGVDIIAYDNMSWVNNPKYAPDKYWYAVRKGSEAKIKLYPDRTLLLCWPPQKANYPLASNALKIFTGNTVIYIGERKYGATGDAEFFDLVRRDFKPVKIVTLPNWPGYSDRLTVYQRKSAEDLTVPDNKDKPVSVIYFRNDSPEGLVLGKEGTQFTTIHFPKEGSISLYPKDAIKVVKSLLRHRAAPIPVGRTPCGLHPCDVLQFSDGKTITVLKKDVPKIFKLFEDEQPVEPEPVYLNMADLLEKPL